MLSASTAVYHSATRLWGGASLLGSSPPRSLKNTSIVIKVACSVSTGYPAIRPASPLDVLPIIGHLLWFDFISQALRTWRSCH